MIDLKKNVFLDGLNAVILYLFAVFIATYQFFKYVFGEIDVSQFLFFTRVNCGEGVNTLFALKIIFFCFVAPLVVTLLIFCLVKRLKKDGRCYYSRLGVLGIGVFYLYISSVCFNFSTVEIFALAVVFFFLFILNLNRCFTSVNVFYCLLLGGLLFFYYITVLFSSNFVFKEREETNFYAENYVDILKHPIKNTKKRNVIVLFVESFNEAFRNVKSQDIVLHDEEGIKFSNFIEGYAQRWTQAALFSSFTGVHIHYISDFWRYKQRVKYKTNSHDFINDAVKSSIISGYFDFETPNIGNISKIATNDGYQSLFVQGTSIDFSGTGAFLRANGFRDENIYAVERIKEEFGIAYSDLTVLEGYNDREIFGVFKHKIQSLCQDNPFFAVMFTMDMHAGYKKDFEEIKEENIENLNDFLAWFKQQEFYENTTLVILGDHNQQGRNVKTGAKIYNAFFNLPNKLKQNVNTNRTFNQIDMFPTLLEIMGYDLPERKAGMGTSLFSDKKTLAERYSYQEQEKIFNKNDVFYFELWQKEKREER